MKKIYYLILIILIGCVNNTNTKVELNSEDEPEISKEISIELSTSDNMLFDKKIIYILTLLQA